MLLDLQLKFLGFNIKDLLYKMTPSFPQINNSDYLYFIVYLFHIMNVIIKLIDIQ